MRMIGRDMAAGKGLGQDDPMSTATAENLKEKASDGMSAAGDLAAGKLEEAKGMIDQIREMVTNRDFSGAQEMLTKLENMPMYDKLPASVTDNVASLRDKIQAGLNAMNK